MSRAVREGEPVPLSQCLPFPDFKLGAWLVTGMLRRDAIRLRAKILSHNTVSQHATVLECCYDMKMTHGSRTLGPDKTKGHYRVIRTYPGTVLSFLVPGCCTVTVGCCSGTSGPGVMTRYSPVLMSRRCDGCMSGSCGTAALRGSPMTP